jgi:hypothetical protein
MSTSTTTAAGAGFPLASILTIIFVIAKLVGGVTWSWWWVFSPLWISGLLSLGILAVILLVVILAALFNLR